MSQRPGRRWACPSLAVPMATGDGLLVRLAPWREGASSAQLVRLAELIERYGNGDIDLTQRGNLQARGFSTASAKRFAAELSHVMPQAEALPAVTLEPNAQGGALLVALRDRLVERLSAVPLPLSPKCSVVIEEQGRYGVGGLSADLRLRITSDGYWLGVGGRAREARWFRSAEQYPDSLLDTSMALLTLLAEGGSGQRGRELKHAEALTTLLAQQGATPALPAIDGQPSELGSGVDGSLLVAAPYGALDAATLRAVGEWCAMAEATLWPLPQRRLLLLPQQPLPPSRALAELGALGLITHHDDARLAISVCRGAPGCAAAHMQTRPLANTVAEVIASSGGRIRPVHVSGCAKGCARPNDAALCLVGEDESSIAVVPNGLAHDAPVQQLTLNNRNLAAALRELVVQR
ncbi:Sulfite reductase [Carnimonas sp. R-84981]|uniref:hypothetical protein n=1 Tax=Carnimonas bestiolae TaxID=3402172 RepID=UPI003EDC5C88